MSASREKKKRQELAEQGISPKQLAAKERERKRKKKKITTVTVVAIVAVAVIVFVFLQFIWPNMAPKTAVAATLGEHEIKADEMNYFYTDTVYQFCNTNASYLSYILDVSTPLDEQTYDEEAGTTWADNFLDQAAQTAATYYAMYDDAVAEGMSLTEEQQSEIDEQMETLESSVESAGVYSSVNDYLVAAYGKGSNEKSYREYLQMQALARAYSDKYQESLNYSDEELEATYDENPDQYTNVTYRSFYVSKSFYEEDTTEDTGDEEPSEEETEAASAAAMEAAKAAADEMVAACQGDEEAFIQWTRDLAPEENQETYADDDATLCEDYSYDGASSYGRDWLYDDSRKEGDVASFEAEDAGYYVLYFLGTSDNNYDTVTVREILLPATADVDSDGDGASDTTSDDLWTELETRAQDLLKQWQDGDATEDSFAELAKENSQDSYAADGGLMESVMHKELNETLEQWCYDEGRKAGDCEVLRADDGYHILYYVGKGEVARLHMIREDMEEEAYNEWYTSYQEKYEYALQDGTKYVNTSLVLAGEQ